MNSAAGSTKKYFSILQKDGTNVSIKEVGKEECFSGKGIYREARVMNDTSPAPKEGTLYQDSFKMTLNGMKDHQNRLLKSRRLYEFYNNEEQYLFPRGDRTSFINDMPFYPTFLTQCGSIDKNFLKTLFFTDKINQSGYYKYFIMRDGEYFVETVDDEIPVDEVNHKPIWGLSTLYPYQLILLKAWIKEKKGLKGVLNAKPFQFTNCFGFPSYKVFNFKKQIEFIENQHITNEERKQKLQNLRLNSNQFVIIGQTRHSDKMTNLGIQDNRAGYLITPVEMVNKQCQVFRVEAQIPCKWVGELSVIADSSINYKYDQKTHHLDLERSFLVKRKDLLQLFKKYYLAPKNSIFEERYINFSLTLNSAKSHQLHIKVLEGGKLNIKIEMPSSQEQQKQGKVRYPKIKYFLSKKGMNKGSNIGQFPSKPQLKSRLDINKQTYSHSETGKYEHYDIEYAHGCHKSVNQFVGVDKGEYVMHIKIEKGHLFDYNVLFSTNAYIQQVKEIKMTEEEKSELFQSTFYSIGVAYKTEVNITQNKEQQNESIRIGNFFQELGYGFIAITTKVQAKHHIAMRIFPKKLKEAGYMIKCGRYDKENKGIEVPLVFISQKGYPQIAVFRMIKNIPLTERFPPLGTVEFYRITQNDK